MGTKRTRPCAMNGPDKIPPVPPGFVSLTAFTLRRIMADQETAGPMSVDVESDPGIMRGPLRKSEIEKSKSSLVCRPWICSDKSGLILQKYGNEQTEADTRDSMSAALPKGVTWGCANCPDCMKVTARWHPEESHLPELDDAPVFRPTEEEFSDTLEYIAKIRSRVESYGICRIVPPPSWRPPCLLQDNKIWETSKLNTRVQKIDGLQTLYLKRKLTRLHEMETEMARVATDGKHEFRNDFVADSKEAISSVVMSEFEEGPQLSLKSFKKNADNFKREYFSEKDKVINVEKSGAVPKRREPLIARIEGEYWRVIANASEEIEVLCGTSLANQNLESGFPSRDKAEYSEYVESGWNLNNITKLPGSLLRYACDNNSVVSNPQLFIGMCFASQCWRTDNHQLYSLSYMHMGDPKVWYGIPGAYYLKFVDIVKKLFPQLKHPKLIHELVTQFSPSMLTSEGIPVYRCVQNPLEFVLIFPGAYHSEFSCGFNCSESVCFAPFDWLPHGQNIVELYSAYCLKTSISHDKLLLGAALEAVSAQWQFLVMKNNSSNNELWRRVCGKDGILSKALKVRVRAEVLRRDYLCNLSQSRAFDEIDVATKRECCICLYDLHLSAVGCPCLPNRYSCLRHSKQLCSCPWGAKVFFFKYRITELNLLVEALEGNIKAIHVWAKRKAQPNDVHQLNKMTPSTNRQQEAMAPEASPCNARLGADSNTLGTSGRQSLVTPQPENVVVLLSDDEE